MSMLPGLNLLFTLRQRPSVCCCSLCIIASAMCFYAFIARFILLPLDHLVARWDTLNQEPLKPKRPVPRVNSVDQAPNATHGSTFALKHCNFRAWSSSIDCIAGIEYKLTMANYLIPYGNVWQSFKKQRIAVLCHHELQGSLDALQLSLAITLAMAAISGMVQPYLLPQAWFRVNSSTYMHLLAGWWFGTWLLFSHSVGKSNPNWLSLHHFSEG